MLSPIYTKILLNLILFKPKIRLLALCNFIYLI